MAAAFPESKGSSNAKVELPVLDLVLFNTDSSDEKVRASDRQESMRYIMDLVVKDSFPDLFVFCQDKINGPKDKILCEKLGLKPQRDRFVKDAGVYCRSSGNDETYIDAGELEKIHGELPSEADNSFTTAGLKTCVLTPKQEQSSQKRKILLVSWHGPKKISINAKKRCFRRLVQFSRKLQQKKECGIVVIGGDFNMPDKDAEGLLSKEMPDGKVLSDYETTSDRKDIKDNKIDYIVYWPKDRLHIVRSLVVGKDYKREKSSRPFDHPIVTYRVIEAASKPAVTDSGKIASPAKAAPKTTARDCSETTSPSKAAPNPTARDSCKTFRSSETDSNLHSHRQS